MQQLENFPSYKLAPGAIVAKRVISVINHCLNSAAIAFILQLDLCPSTGPKLYLVRFKENCPIATVDDLMDLVTSTSIGKK